MIQVSVEYAPVDVVLLDWGNFVPDAGPDAGRGYGWLSIDTMRSVETMELAAEVFIDEDTARATFETYSPLGTETNSYALRHWGHPLVRCLISKKPDPTDRMLQAFAFHLCARCHDSLLQVLTENNRLAVTGPISAEYDDDDETTWPGFVSARTNVAQVRQAELGAWRGAYKRQTSEGEQLSIYSEVE